MSAGNQTIAGTKTFSSAPVFSSVTASRPLKVDGSNNVTSGTIDLTSSNDVTGALPVANGGTGISSYTAGDIVYASSTNALAKLGVGTSGQVLAVNGSNLPAWTTLSNTLPNGTTTNSTLRYNGTGWVENASVLASSDGAITLTKATNQLVLGTGNTSTISTAAQSGSRTYTIPDAGANAEFVMSAGNQTIAGTKTFSSAPVLSSVTASRPLKVDGSNNVTSGTIDLTSSNDVTGTLPVANGGTGISSYTAGDIVYASSTNALAKLGVGTSGQVLTVNGSNLPAWTTPSTLPSGTATNSTLRYNGTGWVENTSVLASSDGAITLTKATNQLVLGTGNTSTISTAAQSGARTYTIPNAGADADFVMSAGSQTVAGDKTFSGSTIVSGSLTASGAVTLGDNGDNFSINSNAFDVSTAGALSGVTTLSMSDALTNIRL
jgi:hypothetical protein